MYFVGCMFFRGCRCDVTWFFLGDFLKLQLDIFGAVIH